MTPDLIFKGRPAMAKRDKQEQKPANREAIAAALARSGHRHAICAKAFGAPAGVAEW